MAESSRMLVEDLRCEANHYRKGGDGHTAALLNRAADEIDRLQQRIELANEERAAMVVDGDTPEAERGPADAFDEKKLLVPLEKITAFLGGLPQKIESLAKTGSVLLSKHIREKAESLSREIVEAWHEAKGAEKPMGGYAVPPHLAIAIEKFHDGGVTIQGPGIPLAEMVGNHADMRVFVDGQDTRSAAPTEPPADDPQLPRGGYF